MLYPPYVQKATSFFMSKSSLCSAKKYHFFSHDHGIINQNPAISSLNALSAVTAKSQSWFLINTSRGFVPTADKFTDDVDTILPKFRCTDPSREGFLFRNSAGENMKDAGTEVHHRDAGTEMTPLGSSTNSRCPTPYKVSSPPRHNTPADRSGPLGMDTCHDNNGGITAIDMNQLKECHLAKLQLGTQYDSIASNWSSREEEEEDISKSLRHFETNNANGFQKFGVLESRTGAASWEDEEKMKCCLRYQREEAKIQAWLNLESAKAEAQSRKLEVKIQKMRSNLEEKLMKRMANVHRKAEEWREQARQQHSDQIQKATEQAKKIINHHHHRQDSHFSGYASCGCFPCTSYH